MSETAGQCHKYTACSESYGVYTHKQSACTVANSESVNTPPLVPRVTPGAAVLWEGSFGMEIVLGVIALLIIAVLVVDRVMQIQTKLNQIEQRLKHIHESLDLLHDRNGDIRNMLDSRL